MQGEQDPVKLLVTFPAGTAVRELARLLEEEYLFIQLVKVVRDNQLLISYDCMADLLEIDFTEQFGALHAHVKNSNSFSIEMQRPIDSDDDQLETLEHPSSSTCPFSPHNDFQRENLANSPKVPDKIERLTSLEDEVVEEERLRKEYELFDEATEDWKIYEEEETSKEDKQGREDETESEKSGEQWWGPVLGGVVLTSLLVGGAKALRMFFR